MREEKAVLSLPECEAVDNRVREGWPWIEGMGG